MQEVEVDIDDQGTASQETSGPIFPLSRVKKIMKADKDVHMCSADAVLLAAFAAESFLEYFSDEVIHRTLEEKKKTVSYKETANTVSQDPRLQFLTTLIPQQIPVAKAFDIKRSVQSQTTLTGPASDDEQ